MTTSRRVWIGVAVVVGIAALLNLVGLAADRSRVEQNLGPL